MGFGEPFGSPFYSGGGASTLVPSQFDAAIAGQVMMLDRRENNAGWATGDIPVQRAQADTEADPSEATLSTEALWRRTRRSYHLGAGQEWADRATSNPYRFDASTGVDVWTEDRLALLPDTTEVHTSASAQHLVVAGTRVFVTDGTAVRASDDGTTWVAITGGPAATALSLATDGATVYVAFGSANGVYTIAPGASAMAAYATGTALAVAYVKGRLLVVETSTANPRVYNVTAAGAITAGNLLLTVPGGSFETGQWAAEGPAALYVAAQVGDKTRLWRTAVKPDGSELDVPVIAGEIPDGQLVRSIQGCLGSVMLVGALATDFAHRVWVLRIDADGNLGIPIGNIETENACFAFEPQDRFVWYGGETGALSRMDLSASAEEESFSPVRATDLAAGQSGHVASVVTFSDRRMFTVLGRGVFWEADTKVAEGHLDLGKVGFGIGDKKNMLFAVVRHEPLADGDAVAVEVAADGGAFEAVGASDTPGGVSKTLGLGQIVAEQVNLRLVLTGDPVVTMVTLLAVPAPKVGERVRWRALLRRTMDNAAGQPVTTDNVTLLDAPTFLNFIRDLREARTAVIMQLGSESFVGIVDRLVEFNPEEKANGDNGEWLGWWQGTAEFDTIRVEA